MRFCSALTQLQHLSRLARVLTLSLLLACLLATTQQANATTPNLPDALRVKTTEESALPTMVELYADWCSVCKRMDPEVKAIEKETKNHLRVLRLNVDKPQIREMFKGFKVQGTPTYVIFDKAGKPVYRMDVLISSTLLRSMALRESGQARSFPFPRNIDTLDVSPADDHYVMLSFNNGACKRCNDAGQYLAFINKRYNGQIQSVALNPDLSEVQQYQKTLGLKSQPSYILLDTEGHEFLRIDAPMTRDHVEGLSRFFKMLMSGRP